ncbi:MFS transporter [Sinomonas albida]|uniref:MFS transporter n=1 Tax=Sinomonas albida TaxID=369942 RepID=UPI001B3C5E99|nr:MFS transporter [Sinomonas albida]
MSGAQRATPGGARQGGAQPGGTQQGEPQPGVAHQQGGTRADRPFGFRYLGPLLLGSTLNPINSSMIATGLVGIGTEFHLGPGQTASLISVLYLFSSVMQPTMGKLASLFGPRRVFIAGILILLAAGIVGALAPSFGFLLASRALIGIGTSAAYPTAMAMVRARADRLSVGVPSRVLGAFSIAAQVTVVVGLPLGGILVGTLGWRALFSVNIPLALVTLAATLVGVERDAPRPSGPWRELVRLLDLPGVALFGGAVAALLVFLSGLGDPAWWLGACAVVVGGVFVWRERHASSPLIDVRALASNGPLQRTYTRQLLVGLGMYACMYGMSQWMEQGRGLTPEVVGIVMVPLSLVSIVVARLVSLRGWVRMPLVLAGLAFLATAVMMVSANGSTSIAVLVLMTSLLGLMNGFGGFANQTALYMQSPADGIAVAAGLYRTFSYMGAIFSSSLIGLVFGARATDPGFHSLAWVLSGIGGAVLVMTLADRRIPRVAA